MVRVDHKVLVAVLMGALAAPVFGQAPSKPGTAHKSPAPATSSAVTVSVPHPLLPDAFAGWEAKESPKGITDPAQADKDNAAALKEYGFQSAMLAAYQKDAETLTIRALRFDDVSGAYGAYTYYRGTGWPKEDIGTGGASNHNRVLFWKGEVMVDATFSHVSPMSGSELRELANQLPVPTGNKSLAPPILVSLPKASLDGQSTHYAVGPASYSGSGGVLPVELVGLDRGAETATATYSLRSNPAVLTLIDYPTPQMAAAQEIKIRDYIKAGAHAQPPFPKPLTDSDQASLEVRRSGPIVALVSGDAIPEESHKLLERVHYEADFVSIPQPGESEVSKTGRLLLGIATLCIIGAGTAIFLGFILGGGRALYRLSRGRPISSVYDTEFIHLNLRD